MNLQEYRKQQLKVLPAVRGVYALCDLDKIPIYIGKSTEGIRARVSRHLTSARSDVIANRQLDVWEIAYVWAWPLPNADKQTITILEDHLIGFYHPQSPLVNGKLTISSEVPKEIPEIQEIEILPPDEILKRKDPLLRLPRQITHFNNLFSHVLEVKDNRDTRRALETHFKRLSAYYAEYMAKPTLSEDESESES